MSAELTAPEVRQQIKDALQAGDQELANRLTEEHMELLREWEREQWDQRSAQR